MNTKLTTTQLLFDQLNMFRATNGKAPLKAWKESRAKLEAAINAELPKTVKHEPVSDNTTATVATIAPKTDRVDTSTDGTNNPERTAALKAAREANEAKDAALAKLEAESPSPSAVKVGSKKFNESAKAKSNEKSWDKKERVKSKTTKAAGFSAAQIIAEFGITGKIGRALLRKHNVDRTPEAIRAFFKARAK